MKNDAQALMNQQAELAEAAIYAQEWINTAISILEKQPAILRSEQPNQAFDALAASVDGLDWLHQLANAAHNLGEIEFDESGDSAFSKFGSSLLKITTELVSVMESSDTLLLADLVEYELLPLLANFRQSANELVA
jgi:hypothetical protein